MKVIEIDAIVFRAAQWFAAKSDVRKYLEGVFVGQNGDVVGTNGHRLFYSKTAFQGKYKKMTHSPLGRDIVIKLTRKVPKGACKLRITIHKEDDIHSTVLAEPIGINRNIVGNVIAGELIGVKYAEYKRVLDSSDYCRDSRDGLSGLSCIGFNPDYLKDISKILGRSISMTISNQYSCMVVEPLGITDRPRLPEETKIFIMPIRLEG